MLAVVLDTHPVASQHGAAPSKERFSIHGCSSGENLKAQVTLEILGAKKIKKNDVHAQQQILCTYADTKKLLHQAYQVGQNCLTG